MRLDKSASLWLFPSRLLFEHCTVEGTGWDAGSTGMLGQLGTPVFVIGCMIDPSKPVCHTGKLDLKVKIYWLKRVCAMGF